MNIGCAAWAAMRRGLTVIRRDSEWSYRAISRRSASTDVRLLAPDAQSGHYAKVGTRLVVSLIVLASCGGASTSSPSNVPTAAPVPSTGIPEAAVDGPVMRYPTSSDATNGMLAEVRGVLQLEGSCLYVALDEISERYPMLWPAGTTWDSTGQAVVPPKGAPMPIGSAVYGGGGYMKVTEVERLAEPKAAALATECVDGELGVIAIVNNQDEAIALAGT